MEKERNTVDTECLLVDRATTYTAYCCEDCTLPLDRVEKQKLENI